MAYKKNYKLWESEFYNNVSAKDRVQDNNFNEFKLKVNDTYEKDEKITTTIEAINGGDVINKASLDKK